MDVLFSPLPRFILQINTTVNIHCHEAVLEVRLQPVQAVVSSRCVRIDTPDDHKIEMGDNSVDIFIGLWVKSHVPEMLVEMGSEPVRRRLHL